MFVVRLLSVGCVVCGAVSVSAQVTESPKLDAAKPPESVVTSQEKMTDRECWEKLSGDWVPHEMIINGKPAPEQFMTSIKLNIKDKKYFTLIGDLTDVGELAIDLSGEIMAMDLKGTEGPNKDKTYPTIFRFKDDKLVICYNVVDGGERPEKFESSAGTMMVLTTYKRTKTEKESGK